MIPVKTSCKECVFAQSLNGIQTGCELGRLSIFESRGEIISDNEPFATINRFCNTCRNQEWANQYQNIYEQIEKESKIQYGVILVEQSNDEEEIVIKNLDNSLNSLLLQHNNMIPTYIILGLQNSKVDKNKIRNRIKTILQHRNIVYYISHILEKNADYRRIVDLCFTKLDTQYYTHIANGCTFDNNYGNTLNTLLNKNMQPFIMINGFHHNSPTYINMIHMLLCGNKGDVLERKIEELAKLQNQEEMILSYERIS